jgi:signal transduction histidine kinase
MMERLSCSFTQIRQFSADVSHELRTPLTIVRGQLEVALFTAKTTEQYREAMVNALEDVERLSNIIRALLMLSQAESGQLVLKKTSLDLAEAVRDMVEEFQIPAEANGVELVAHLPEHCPIQADRTQIERLLSNLVSNAVKYTPSGGKVEVSVTGEGDRVRLVVADNGVGIAPDHLPHIFDRFYRVPSADPEKGLGLGLSFVVWIVKAHDGTIDVQSEPGKGTTFTVNLPPDPRPAAEQQVPALVGSEKLN